MPTTADKLMAIAELRRLLEPFNDDERVAIIFRAGFCVKCGRDMAADDPNATNPHYVCFCHRDD